MKTKIRWYSLLLVGLALLLLSFTTGCGQSTTPEPTPAPMPTPPPVEPPPVVNQQEPTPSQTHTTISAPDSVQQSMPTAKERRLVEAAWDCDKETIIELLSDNKVNVDARNEFGTNALMAASEWGCADLVELLIKSYGANVNIENYYGRTALMLADYSSIDTMEVLVQNGADVDVRNDCCGSTVLMLVAGSYDNYLDVVSLLINNGADVNARDNEGKTAIDYAQRAATDKTEIIQLLQQASRATVPQTSVETYINTRFGFSVEYPVDWVVSEDVYPEHRGITVAFSAGDYPLTDMHLYLWTANDTSYFDSLEDFYYRGVIATWLDAEGFEILSEQRTSVQKLPAKEIIFNHGGDNMGDVCRSAIVAFMDTRFTNPEGSNAIKLVYHAPLDDYELTFPVFEEIVDSFEFTEAGGR